MMASNVLSRLLPSANGSPSVYETIRQYDEESNIIDVEEQAGLTLDERNLGEHFQDEDLDNVQLGASEAARTLSPTRRETIDPRQVRGRLPRYSQRSRWQSRLHRPRELDDGDDDVPASLLIEGVGEGHKLDASQLPPPPSFEASPVPVPGPSSHKTRQQWQRAQEQHGLHGNGSLTGGRSRKQIPSQISPVAMASAYEKTMWRWMNVENVDTFLAQVYDYYTGHGFWAIILYRCYSLVTLAFVVGFSFFLTQCIDYRRLRGSTKMSEIVIPKCTAQMGVFPNIVLWFTTLLWLSKLFQYILRIRTLWMMHDFYLYLLDIPEKEIQSTAWQDVVSRLMALRDANPYTAEGARTTIARNFLGAHNKQRMDAHDIANRLMRKENYLIAMFNKDILDMSLDIPFMGKRQFFSRTLEWNIYQCIIDFVFNPQGHVRPIFLKTAYRNDLVEGLRRRFIFAGFTNLVIAPIIITYNLVEFFFQNFNEYQKNPAQIGSHRYNPLAEWKFREFNELWHIFERRMNMSYPFASRYVDQFPKFKTIQTARFITFVTGALISVLFIASAFDPDLFLGFEISSGRTVLFYITIFGSIWAVARGLLPDENTVHDTAYTMSEVIEFTHYKPAHWDGKLNSDEVRQEFSQLYQLKLVIFLEEVFSMFFTPFVLWYALPQCTERIIDFFREFTVHVDGLGYVCSFAEFNFARNGNVPLPNPLTSTSQRQRAQGAATAAVTDPREDFYATKNQKLEASYWGFMNDYARNPKTDVRFPYYPKSKFHPPPPVPGLPSPTLPSTVRHTGDNTAAASTGRQGGGGSILHHLTSPTGRLRTGFQSGTPRFNAGPEEASPLHSMLLDPHHQPGGSILGGIGSPAALRPRSMGKSRLGKTIATLEEEDGHQLGNLSSDAQAATTQEQKKAEDSGGEPGSWKMNRNASSDDDDSDGQDEEDIEAVTGRHGGVGAGGVLEMLRQFRRAQEDGRAAIAGGGAAGGGGGGGIGGAGGAI